MDLDKVNALAEGLTTGEFELLIRKRIERNRAMLLARDDVSEYYCNVNYRHDKEGGRWSLNVGKGYENAMEFKGECLDILAEDAIQGLRRRNQNKISLQLTHEGAEDVENV